MKPAFEKALMHAVALLRELPRGREGVRQARKQLERFRQSHPGLPADLLVDQPPASAEVDYDLMLEHPEGGTVAVSWRADNAIPWSVAYADHWASNYVLSVNNLPITVQQALLFLKLACDESLDLMTELIDQALIANEMKDDLSSLNKEELQTAADGFRSANHLESADATRRWLQETGLSVTRFEELLTHLIHRQKLEERITEKKIKPYFELHRKKFVSMRLFRMDTRDGDLAKCLAGLARNQGLAAATYKLLISPEYRDKDITGALVSRFALELPSKMAIAPIGAVIGPIAEEQKFWVAQIIHRRPARFDEQTRAVIRDHLFREWLAKRRDQATVRWHWV